MICFTTIRLRFIDLDYNRIHLLVLRTNSVARWLNERCTIRLLSSRHHYSPYFGIILIGVKVDI